MRGQFFHKLSALSARLAHRFRVVGSCQLTWINLLGARVRIRRFEEKCAELYQKEKIRGFLHLYIGEEAIAVGGMQVLSPADAVLARGASIDAVMAEMYGKAEGSSRGRSGRCICSMRPPASTAATPLSVADCRSPSG